MATLSRSAGWIPSSPNDEFFQKQAFTMPLDILWKWKARRIPNRADQRSPLFFTAYFLRRPPILNLVRFEAAAGPLSRGAPGHSRIALAAVATWTEEITRVHLAVTWSTAENEISSSAGFWLSSESSLQRSPTSLSARKYQNRICMSNALSWLQFMQRCTAIRPQESRHLVAKDVENKTYGNMPTFCNCLRGGLVTLYNTACLHTDCYSCKSRNNWKNFRLLSDLFYSFYCLICCIFYCSICYCGSYFSARVL